MAIVEFFCTCFFFYLLGLMHRDDRIERKVEEHLDRLRERKIKPTQSYFYGERH